VACTAPYLKTGSAVPQSTQSSDTCDDLRNVALASYHLDKRKKFPQAVKAANKSVVYFVPMNIDVIGKFDVNSETYSDLTFSALTGTTQNYKGGTLVGSKIYMTPMNKNHFGVFDTATEQYSTIPVYTASNPNNMVEGPAALIGTKLYACPNRAGDVMAVIDTTTDTVSTIPLDAVPNYSGRRFAGSYAVGDKIVCAPYGTFDGGIGIFDTTGQTWTRRSITDVVPDQASNGYYMYSPGCVAGDVVYFPGDRRAGIGKYNVTADDFYEIALNQPAGAFRGCAVLDGKAYFAPRLGRSILVLDVATDSYQLLELIPEIDDIHAVNSNWEMFGTPAIAVDKFIFPPYGVNDIGILQQQKTTNQIKHALSQGSGPTIWYTTADASSVLKGSQGEVTGWTDATGNGYNLGAGTDVHAPTLEMSTNGKYAVRVGGDSGKYLRSADLFVNMGLADIPQPFTVMAVIKIDSGSNYLMDGYGLDTFVVAIDNSDNIFPFPTTNSAWRGTGGASLTGNCGFPSAGWGVHEWVFSNTAGETAIYKADGTAPCIDDTTAKMSHAYTLTGLTIGDDGALRTYIDPGVSWREFMIFPGTLTRQESARYREYLDDIAS